MATWSVSDDGLIPIADALDWFAKYPGVASLPADIQCLATSPSHLLSARLNEPKLAGMAAGRVEMVRGWLQTNGYTADSDEFRQHIFGLLERLKTWERLARQAVAVRAAEVEERKQSGRYCEIVDYFGDDLCEAFNDLTDVAWRASDYVRRLAGMLRSLRERTAPTPDVSGKPAPTTATRKTHKTSVKDRADYEADRRAVASAMKALGTKAKAKAVSAWLRAHHAGIRYADMLAIINDLREPKKTSGKTRKKT